MSIDEILSIYEAKRQAKKQKQDNQKKSEYMKEYYKHNRKKRIAYVYGYRRKQAKAV
jgi:hypothetical protein